MPKKHTIFDVGQAFPIGATVLHNGVNFSIYSQNATRIDLLLFEDVNSKTSYETIMLDKNQHRTGFYWHIFVNGLKDGQVYAYRVHGPFSPVDGHRFNPKKVLLDPYGKSVAVPHTYKRELSEKRGDNTENAMKSVVVDTSRYDWEETCHPRHPYSKSIIYELHVKGFTNHPNSGVGAKKRGTYAGLIEKIPYLEDLGITAVELLPIFQFDEQDAPKGKTNYWGYSPVSFFAAHHGYSSQKKNPIGALDEFRDMVKAFHRANIEVILDVVFNHTAENNENGPTFGFKGIENSTYYMLDGESKAYADYSGCGNTINANHSVVRRMIRDSLRFWVSEMQVDGFRFDLASILSRDEFGNPQVNPPILWEIESDPVLAGTKLIAEAWDASGFYQVGSFIGDRWCEWNGKFRDDVRSFMRGDDGSVSNFASRLLASPDIYGHKKRPAEVSVNFITCHDGFTLNDLVSYNEKHNEANGEGNQDGENHNLSWNCGVEGPTTDTTIQELRMRQIKNFLTITLLPHGVPMLLMGDEIRRTQLGNNNAYCQDNETSWFDWDLVNEHAALHRFVKMLINFRTKRDLGTNYMDLSLIEYLQNERIIHWNGVKLGQPDWSYTSHSLACTSMTKSGDSILHLICNAYSADLDFVLPDPRDFERKKWVRIIDTSLPTPEDIALIKDAKKVQAKSYTAMARSVVLLAAL